MSQPPQPKAKQIRNPRRLLILSPSSHSISLIPTLLNKLTDHPIVDPPAPTQSFAGYTTHPPLRLQNKYYTAEVPIWVDEIPLGQHPPSTSTSIPVPASEDGTVKEGKEGEEEKETATTTASQWETEFSGPEAQVVRHAIGAVMICVQNPVAGVGDETTSSVEGRDDVRDLKDFIRAIGQVRALIEEERGEVGEVPGLLVLGEKQQQQQERKTRADAGEEGDLDAEAELDDPFSIGWWEDQLCEMGLMGVEVVRWNVNGGVDEEKRNEYGELQGMRRIKEVLETHEWTSGDEDLETGLLDDDDLERELLGLDEDGSGFDQEVNQLEREMVGLRMSIERGGDFDEDEEGNEELRVEAVEALMLRMKAIKDMSDELPEKDRKRFAAKAVRDIMKEI